MGKKITAFFKDKPLKKDQVAFGKLKITLKGFIRKQKNN